MIQDLFLLDIETVPMVESYDMLLPEWQTLWWDKISKTVPENTSPAEAWKMKAGILAEFGKIVCISTAYFYEDDYRHTCLKVKSIASNNEVEVLQGFVDLCGKMYKHNKNFQFAGHNIKEFDIPYICRRMMINHLPLPEYLWLHDRKPWEVKMFDTLNWWKFGDNKNYISLHLLANVLGLPTSKSDIDGSMVQTVFYEEQNLERIVAYCQKDVVLTAKIILCFKGLPMLRDERVVVVD
jgi:predicted PolB exonuclease-like 3'-5' exonuclease